MLERDGVKISTDNTGINGAEGEKVPIKEEITITVPESVAEAAEFFGGEGKLLDVLQAETQRRKVNAARAVIRDIDNPNTDFAALATQVAEAYTPGRRGGFQAPTVDQDELDAVSGDMGALMALLQAKGVSISV